MTAVSSGTRSRNASPTRTCSSGPASSNGSRRARRLCAARADLSYGNTRLHARRGALLRAADYERLIGEDVDGLLEMLETTPYARDIDAAERARPAAALHAAIRTNVGRSLEEMRSFYAERARELVDLCSHASTSRTSSRCCAPRRARSRPRRARSRSRPSAGWSNRWRGELLRQRELAGAVDLLARSTPGPRPGACAARGIRRIRAHRGSRGARAGRRRRPRRSLLVTLAAAGGTASTLLRFMRREIDERNLLSALRLRDALAAAPPPRRRRTRCFPAARRRPPRSRPRCTPRRRTRSPRRSARVGGEAWRAPLARWAATGDLTALERELERPRIADAAALFASGDPLAIDVPLAYMAAKLAEARNCVSWARRPSAASAPDVVRRELLWPGVRA